MRCLNIFLTSIENSLLIYRPFCYISISQNPATLFITNDSNLKLKVVRQIDESSIETIDSKIDCLDQYFYFSKSSEYLNCLQSVIAFHFLKALMYNPSCYLNQPEMSIVLSINPLHIKKRKHYFLQAEMTNSCHRFH